MAAAEAYYEAEGRTWERAAYIKARSEDTKMLGVILNTRDLEVKAAGDQATTKLWFIVGLSLLASFAVASVCTIFPVGHSMAQAP